MNFEEHSCEKVMHSNGVSSPATPTMSMDSHFPATRIFDDGFVMPAYKTSLFEGCAFPPLPAITVRSSPQTCPPLLPTSQAIPHEPDDLEDKEEDFQLYDDDDDLWGPSSSHAVFVAASKQTTTNAATSAVMTPSTTTVAPITLVTVQMTTPSDGGAT